MTTIGWGNLYTSTGAKQKNLFLGYLFSFLSTFVDDF